MPTVRHVGEAQGAPLIRINPVQPDLFGVPGVALAENALVALRGIAAALEERAG